MLGFRNGFIKMGFALAIKPLDYLHIDHKFIGLFSKIKYIEEWTM